MEFRVIIPVRYDSVRLPGKPLIDIAGKPMVQWVHEQASQSGAESVVIATDDERIQKAAEKFGATVCMTSKEHESGTDRLSEVVTAMDYDDDDIIVNVQGDEPLIPPKLIHQVAENLHEHNTIKIATLCEPIDNREDLFNPHHVKVVVNARGFALYFSRAPIPWHAKRFANARQPDEVLEGVYFRHIGLYAYRASFLQEYLKWDVSPLEEVEQLEQLRVLWNGGRIHVGVAKEKAPVDVNTEKDVERIRALVK